PAVPILGSGSTALERTAVQVRSTSKHEESRSFRTCVIRTVWPSFPCARGPCKPGEPRCAALRTGVPDIEQRSDPNSVLAHSRKHRPNAASRPASVHARTNRQPPRIEHRDSLNGIDDDPGSNGNGNGNGDGSSSTR